MGLRGECNTEWEGLCRDIMTSNMPCFLCSTVAGL